MEKETIRSLWFQLSLAAIKLNAVRNELRNTCSLIAGCDLQYWSQKSLEDYLDLFIATRLRN